MDEFLDFFLSQPIEPPVLIFLMIFSCGIALFHTVILSMLFNVKLRPVWIFFIIDPAIVGLAYLVRSGFAALALIVLFASLFILAIVGAIYNAIRGDSEEREYLKRHPAEKKPLWKKILTVVAVIIFIPLFFSLGPYVFIVIFAIAILSGIMPSSKNRFKKYQATLPTSKIRSVAMGLAEVEGRLVAGSGVLVAPIDSIKCLGYKYVVENISKDDKGKESYSEIFSETKFADFFIEDNTGRLPVHHDKMELIWVDVDGRYSSGSKRYSQYLLKENDEVLIIGKASLKNGQPVIEHENVKNVFGIAPKDKVIEYNAYKPLLNSFILFSCVLALFVAIVLITPITVNGTTVVVKLNSAMFTWGDFLSKF